MAPDSASGANPLDVDFLASLRSVRSRLGKSALAQLAEIAALTFTGNRLSPLDYYRFQLYDDSLHDRASKRRFVGDRRCHETAARVVDRAVLAQVADKLSAARFLEDHGFPVPAIRAVQHPARSHPGAEHLTTDGALADWLRTGARYPLFAKPIRGFQGRGAIRLDRLDRERDALTLPGDASIGVDEFVAGLQRNLAALRPGVPVAGPAYLFQDRVAQHAEVAERCGESVACVRAMVGVEPSAVRPLAWIWKIPAPHHSADNLHFAGNLVAALDPESGEVRRLVRGCGVALEHFDANPHTGRRLVGWRLPHFAALRETVLRGARLLPGLGQQSWDVAVGPDGPVVIEVNPGGTHSMPQLATGRGFWSEEMMAFLRRAEAANPTRPRGLRRLSWWGHPLGRLHGAGRLLGNIARSGRPR